VRARLRLVQSLVIAAVLLAGAARLPADEARPSAQFGTQRLDFEIAGCKAFLLLPTKAAPDGSRPWLWYAPTFMGRHPDPSHAWMFERLLAKGFTIGGVEVGESHGSPKGRAVYTEFYRHVVAKHGLSPRACLLPQSRGGLMLYNWAVEDPEAVQCIGGIYTVCDLTSYPGVARACGAYGMAEAELREHLAEQNPIDRLAPLAKAKVPILHLHGDADNVVPLERNSAELARRYRALGGPVELIVVKGKGHQVCDEFFHSQRLVDFFLSLGRLEPRGEPSYSVEELPAWDALFRRESGWTGADVASTVALSADKTLWLFGDTWVGEIRNGKHADSKLVNNSVALQSGKDPAKAKVEFFYGKDKDGKPAALVIPADGRGWFWLFSGVRTPQGLFLFAAQAEKAGRGDDAFGFRHVGMWLLSVANPEDRPTEWRVTQARIPLGAKDTVFGSALLARDGFVYIYGSADEVVGRFHLKHALVARVPEADLGRFDQWHFFADGQWQADGSKASRLFDHAASEYSVSFQPALGKFVAVCTRDGMFGQIQVRLAAAPEGPWGEPVTVYNCPEMKWDKRVFCYAAKGHPELSAAPDELILTYVANSTDFWHMAGDARLYWPRFLRLKFGAGPKH